MLCLLLLNRGALTGLLYLENGVAENAFTKDRLTTLELVASQAAISIDNALLYRDLEQRVAARTAELAGKSRDVQAMLQNLKQGIFILLPDGSIHAEYSRHLEVILGRKPLVGMTAADLLFGATDLGSDALDRIEATLLMTLGQDEFAFSLNAHHLPREFCIFVGDERKVLEVDWEPILDDDAVLCKLMVILRDVTHLRELQAEADRRQMESSMTLDLLDLGVGVFERFADSARALLRDNQTILIRTRESLSKGETLSALYRDLHTLKGNARTCDLRRLVDTVHDAEQRLQDVRDANSDALDLAVALSDFEICARVVDRKSRSRITRRR